MTAEIPEIPLCAECGKQHITKSGHPSCAAHRNKQPDEPCGAYPAGIEDKCNIHCGKSRAKVKERAEDHKRQVQLAATVAELIAECDVEDEADPLDALLSVLKHSHRMVRALRKAVGTLSPVALFEDVDIDLEGGGTKTVTRMVQDGALYMPTSSGMAAHPLERMLADWTDRVQRASKAAIDAGIEERIVARQERLEEQHIDQLEAAVQGMLTALDLTPEQAAKAPDVIAQLLVAIVGES